VALRDLLLKISGDPSDAKEALDDVADDLRKFDRLSAEARADIKTKGAEAQLKILRTRLENLSRQEATPKVELATAKTLKSIERVERELEQLGGKTFTPDVRPQVHGSEGAAKGARGGSLGAGAAGGLAAKAGPIGAGIVVGGLALKKAADATVEAEKSAAALRAQLKALGISYDANAKKIDTQVQKVSNLSGLDDEDLADSFTNIVRVTGDVDKSLNLVGLAADFARAKNIDVAKAGEIVGKVAGGNTGILSRYGIQLDKGATATEALGVLQSKFAGQAKAYGDTTGGAIDRAAVAAENLAEGVGTGLTPALAFLADGFVAVVGAVQAAWPQVVALVGAGVAAVKGFLKDNKADIDAVRRAFNNVATAVRRVFEEVVIPVVANAIATIRAALGPFVEFVRGVVNVLSGILTGDFGRIWEGVKGIFRGALGVLRALLRGAINQLGIIAGKIATAVLDAVASLPGKMIEVGKNIVRGLIKGIKSAPGAVKDAIEGLAGGLIGGITGKLGIKSPSTVFAEIGGYVTDGLANGLRAGMANVTAAASVALTAPVLAAAPAPAVAAAGGGGTTIHAPVTLPAPPGGGAPDPYAAATAIGRELERRGR